MQVFISYRRTDNEFAEQLRSDFEKSGFATWMDTHDIPKGAYWPDAIDAGLRSSDVVIGIISPEAITSRNVKNEWDWALDNGKRLILLLWRKVESMPHRYTSLNFIDCTANLEHALGQLLHFLTAPAVALYRNDHSMSTPAHTEAPSALAPAKLTDRDRFLQNISDTWIRGVLEKSIEHSIQLGLSSTPGAVIKHRDYGDYVFSETQSIVTVFNDLQRQLLILGAPGSGKTTLLLQLARDLIAQARQNEDQPIPVIFNLSTWSMERKPLAAWVEDEFRLRYQVPRRITRRWIGSECLVLLLDGFDEVKESSRAECVEAINGFCKQYSTVDLVICSRSGDYESLTTKLDIAAAITVEPLDETQIADYLSVPSLSGLREVVSHNAHLQKLTHNPFFLNLMAQTYKDMPATSLRQAASADEESAIRDGLLEQYVEKQLKHTDAPYTFRESRHWLKWLATETKARDQTVFYVEGLQPDWLGENTRWAYRAVLLPTLIVVLFLLLNMALLIENVFVFSSMPDIPIFGVLARIVPVPMFSLGFGVGFLLNRLNKIEIPERLSWRWNARSVATILLAILVIAALGTLTNSVVSSLPQVASLLFAFNLVPGMIVGLILGRFEIGLQTSERIDRRTRPNQGIWKALYNMVFWMIFAWLLWVAQYFFNNFLLPQIGYEKTILIGGAEHQLALALIALGFVVLGGFTVVQHVVLRWMLWRRKVMPFNYTRFLDFAAQQGLLRKVGGGYIFIHRTLLDFFAKT